MIAKIAFILRLTNFFDCKKRWVGRGKNIFGNLRAQPAFNFFLLRRWGKKQKIPDIAIWDCLTN